MALGYKNVLWMTWVVHKMILVGLVNVKVELRQPSHSFSAFSEPPWEAPCSTPNETISADSLIEFNFKCSTFFLRTARQAAEMKESGTSWLLWVLLVSLLQVVGRASLVTVSAVKNTEE